MSNVGATGVRSLRSAQPVLNKMKLPLYFSGSCALVYILRVGADEYAAKIFLEDPPELQRRYQALERLLLPESPPWLVPFTYHRQGVAVGDRFLPVVVMPRTRAQGMAEWVTQNRSPRNLEALRAQFASFISDLWLRHVAHGDIHHGNVRVKNGVLRVLDWDYSYLPTLANLRGVAGHECYNHRERTDQFDRRLDQFPAMVIDVALAALSHAALPGYLTEERLLFDAEDLADPGASALFRKLSTIRPVAKAADLLAQIAIGGYAQIPTFQEFQTEAWSSRPGPVHRGRPRRPSRSGSAAAMPRRVLGPVSAPTTRSRPLPAIESRPERAFAGAATSPPDRRPLPAIKALALGTRQAAAPARYVAASTPVAGAPPTANVIALPSRGTPATSSPPTHPATAPRPCVVGTPVGSVLPPPLPAAQPTARQFAAAQGPAKPGPPAPSGFPNASAARWLQRGFVALLAAVLLLAVVAFGSQVISGIHVTA